MEGGLAWPAVSIVAISATAGLLTALALRRRLPTAAVVVLLGLAGAGVAWGGMLLRHAPAPAEVALAVVAMALLAPAHARIVLGPLGRRR
ncbi:MAG: hypothetical protein M3245_03985 [Actinomycetota bacterium]|nr:hypothetical protein [Actinomycetota bacterium]